MVGRSRVRSQHGGRGGEQRDGSNCGYHQELHGEPSFGLKPWKSLHPPELIRVAPYDCELLHTILLLGFSREGGASRAFADQSQAPAGYLRVPLHLIAASQEPFSRDTACSAQCRARRRMITARKILSRVRAAY